MQEDDCWKDLICAHCEDSYTIFKQQIDRTNKQYNGSFSIHRRSKLLLCLLLCDILCLISIAVVRPFYAFRSLTVIAEPSTDLVSVRSERCLIYLQLASKWPDDSLTEMQKLHTKYFVDRNCSIEKNTYTDPSILEIRNNNDPSSVFRCIIDSLARRFFGKV